MQFRQVPRQHHADLVGEDFLALVVDDAAAVAVAVEAERDVRARLFHRRRHRVQHVQVLGIRIVTGKGEIEIAVERNDLATQRREKPRREGARSAVAAGGDDLQLAPQFRPARQVGDVAHGKLVDEAIAAALAIFEFAADDDFAQAAHLLRPESHRPRGAHLYAGPAVVVVRGGDHRDRRDVERELREIRHRGDRQPDIVHLDAGRHQSRDQRVFDRGGIGAKIVADDDPLLNPELVEQLAEPHAERLNAHQVDFAPEQPTRVVFAKAGRLHQRTRLVGIAVGLEIGLRLGKQGGSSRDADVSPPRGGTLRTLSVSRPAVNREASPPTAEGSSIRRAARRSPTA